MLRDRGIREREKEKNVSERRDEIGREKKRLEEESAL